MRQGVGLADEEVALAARVISAGLPCLRLTEIAPPPDPRTAARGGGPVDLYDTFADVFTVLQVCTPPVFPNLVLAFYVRKVCSQICTVQNLLSLHMQQRSVCT